MVAVRQTLSSMGRVDWSIWKSGECSTKPRLVSTGPPISTCIGADLLRQPDPLDLRNDLELHQQVRQVHVRGGPVEDDPHRAFRRMGADIDDGAREALVRHSRHGDEELPVEIRGFDAVRRKLRAHILKSALPGRPADHRIVDGRPEEKRIREAPQGGVSSMAFMFRAASAAFFLILSLAPIAAQSLQPSASIQGFHSRARLISGGIAGEPWLAGIEIALDPGFKTYWRNPGDSGLPPRFDWSGSENVAGAEVRLARSLPARGCRRGRLRLRQDRCVLPVLVKAKDPGKPVKLVLSVEYGVCKDICIPARADLSLGLTDDGPGRSAIEAALAKVPAPQALGAQGDLSVLAVEPVKQDKPAYSVTVRAPSGAKPALFAEGPENWYLSTSLPDDANRFTVTVEEKPKDASGPVPLRLTLVAGGKAVETEVSLDAGGPAALGRRHLCVQLRRTIRCQFRLENACPRSPSAS